MLTMIKQDDFRNEEGIIVVPADALEIQIRNGVGIQGVVFLNYKELENKAIAFYVEGGRYRAALIEKPTNGEEIVQPCGKRFVAGA